MRKYPPVRAFAPEPHLSTRSELAKGRLRRRCFTRAGGGKPGFGEAASGRLTV